MGMSLHTFLLCSPFKFFHYFSMWIRWYAVWRHARLVRIPYMKDCWILYVYIVIIHKYVFCIMRGMMKRSIQMWVLQQFNSVAIILRQEYEQKDDDDQHHHHCRCLHEDDERTHNMQRKRRWWVDNTKKNREENIDVGDGGTAICLW